MSLRAFHILFIVVSAAFALGFGAWLTGNYFQGDGVVWLFAAVVSLGSAVALALYAIRFSRKTRGLSGAGVR